MANFGELSFIGYTLGLGVILLASTLIYFRQTSKSSEQKKAKELYGDYLRSLNETANKDKAETEWLNMGYWKNTTVFPEACEALALKLVRASKCVAGGCVLDVGHATGESLLLHLTHPEVPRPSNLFGITSLKFQHDRAAARILRASYPEEIKVQLYLGDAVYHPATGTPISPQSSVQTMRHPLEQAANDSTPTHPSYTSIIALDCAHHFRTREQFLAQSAQSLAPGGSIALADMCVDASTPSIAIRTLRRLYCTIFSMHPANMTSIQGYKETMERLGYQNVTIEDISSSVFPGFTSFLQKRGIGWWIFARMVVVWWRICGARFIIASGKRSNPTDS
ncbi:methyltransferase domain protein [Rhizoctonia solani AG-3 Rhs1AP]|uniref:Methyltransferase domain protein n=2 Tax=Rhizoctonia solani AG-3 TaxID=1086053 RepID=A0A074SYJ5_9AGAM|nr:methyltransferase domain protein [Rhizoctonia solani AG-3 Rhs1AP]KEP54912.1 methyltransferase domain protein [Rhizoctonia solani 123E]